MIHLPLLCYFGRSSIYCYNAVHDEILLCGSSNQKDIALDYSDLGFKVEITLVVSVLFAYAA